MSSGIAVEKLHISVVGPNGEPHDIVQDVSFTVAPGEVLALIGESGSGKTTIALALMGYTRAGCHIRSGSIQVGDVDVTALNTDALVALRGRKIAYVAQSAAAAFNPAHRLIDQIIETSVVSGTSRAVAIKRAHRLFTDLALPDPERLGQRYPHEVSGGQLQRAIAAMALMTEPDVIIFDEPTTALDVTTQVEVLQAFRNAVRNRGTTAVYVSHDLAVVAQMADRIAVLRRGSLQEIGRTDLLLRAPSSAYTKSLLNAYMAAAPVDTQRGASPPERTSLLELQEVHAHYGGARGVPALRDITISLDAGTMLGVVGESGSGKSTLARVLTGVLPTARGAIRLDGKLLAGSLEARSKDELRQIQLVTQSADTALNPAHSVRSILARPMVFYHGLSTSAANERVPALLERVKLDPTLADRRPGQLSGGQKQRVNLARALAAEPAVLICDEVTAALDTVVGLAITDLLKELQRSSGIAIIFISHDLRTVERVADEIAVMYAGQIVQISKAAALNGPLRHPYTELLASSIPTLRTDWLDQLASERLARDNLADDAGDRPIPDRLRGCSFYGRCQLGQAGICDLAVPPLEHAANGSLIRCVLNEQIFLRPQSIPQPSQKECRHG
jgi:peptide/nickel transport system ATP-binding protein